MFKREPDDVVPSPRVWYYRNRMDYVVSPRLEVGLRERGKWWAYVDLSECLLQSSESNVIRNEFRRYLVEKGLEGYDTRRHKGLVRYLVVREGKFTGERLVAVITSRPAVDELLDFPSLLRVRVDTFINGVYDGVFDSSRADETIVIKGEGHITERLLDYKYMIRVNSFFQTNSYTAVEIVKVVIEESKGHRSAYDFYSGVGTFTIPLSEFIDEVYGVESDQESVELARENAKLNGVSPVFYTGRVESFSRVDADVVVLDPPRAGLHPKTIRNIVFSSPKKIVYVSCNPRKQAEEVSLLTKSYRLERLVLIDQFPHTRHIETIAVLSR